MVLAAQKTLKGLPLADFYGVLWPELVDLQKDSRMNEMPARLYKYLTPDRTATAPENLQIRLSQARS